MKIIKTYDWCRRDFNFDAECEHCGNISSHGGGYDDSNYYNNVVPRIICKNCGESSLSKITDKPQTVVIPKYDSNITM